MYVFHKYNVCRGGSRIAPTKKTLHLRIKIFSLILFLLWPGFSFADEMTVEPAETNIANPLKLRLTIELKKGEKASLPEKIDLPEETYLLSRKMESTKTLENGSTELTVVYEIESYKVGAATIPQFEYVIVSADGAKSSRNAGPVDFKIASVRNDPATAGIVKDIRSQANISLKWSAYVIPALILLAIIIALALLFKWLSKREHKSIAPPPIPPREASEIAYEELTKLKAENLYGRGYIKEHFFRLSEIVRAYLERRYGLLALERTTFELEYEFDHRYASSDIKTRLIKLLKACDIVKFTKEKSSARQADDAVDRAFELVDLTAGPVEERKSN